MMPLRCAFPLVFLALAACARATVPPSTTAAPTGAERGPVAATSSPASRLAALRLAVDSMAMQPKFRNAHWGILIVDPERGDTLYSRNAGKLFMPASNQKIVTGAAALAVLGPDFTFRTDFATDGEVSDGTLRGDLLVIGRGDPTVSDAMQEGDAMRALRGVADSLVARGIRRLTGRVLAHGNAFPDATLGYGWAWNDLDLPYSAAVDELLFNEGFSRVIVRGGTRAGDAPTVTVRPASRFPMVRVTATTVDSAGANRLSGSVSEDNSVVVSGTVRARDSVVVRVAHRDPNGSYLAALGEALAERGIDVEGRSPASTARGEVPATAAGGGAMQASTPRSRIDTLFTIRSAPLRDILPVFEKPTQNQIGEVLLKTMGLERTGVGSADSGGAVVTRTLIGWGLTPQDFAVRDGSGLSRHNYITPEAVVRILDTMRRSPHFAMFRDALPIAGVDGTIANRMKGTAAEGNARAKTGFIDKARALSGYVTTADGTTLIFSFIANNWTTATREVEEVQDAVTVRLAELRLR
jgi:serine-type D-Ala-D-Ala carboxypeptidase/endopeptidase (penicillin-binding protein 4)